MFKRMYSWKSNNFQLSLSNSSLCIKRVCIQSSTTQVPSFVLKWEEGRFKWVRSMKPTPVGSVDRGMEICQWGLCNLHLLAVPEGFFLQVLWFSLKYITGFWFLFSKYFLTPNLYTWDLFLLLLSLPPISFSYRKDIFPNRPQAWVVVV